MSNFKSSNYLLLTMYSFAIVYITTKGTIFSNIYNYPLINGLMLVIFVIFGYFLGQKPCKNLFRWLFLFYFSLFSAFSDGYVAGWMHSDNIVDKVLNMFVYMYIYVSFLIIPLIILGLTFMHNYIIQKLCKDESSHTP